MKISDPSLMASITGTSMSLLSNKSMVPCASTQVQDQFPFQLREEVFHPYFSAKRTSVSSYMHGSILGANNQKVLVDFGDFRNGSVLRPRRDCMTKKSNFCGSRIGSVSVESVVLNLN
ncbi:hypothetical protein P8452_71031 [Trifolium repens]|nr:hypothetical protein P8452_69254 [Trifolium repens]WJX89003.1 hypothetical protein P8452_71031 [Trifolium repens]